MTPDEIEKHVEDRAQGEFVRWLVEQRADELIDEYRGLHEETGWEPVKLTAAREFPPPSVGLYAPGRHLFTPGYIHLVFGVGESGKTAIDYIVAMQEVRKGNAALIVDFEMGDIQALDRFHAVGMTDEEIDAGIVYVNPQMSLTPRDRAGLVDRVADLGRPLTFSMLDSLPESAAMDGLNENDTGDMTRWFRSLPRWIVRQWPTCATAVNDHLPKDKEDSEFPIGSQRKRSASHALISVRNVAKFDREHEGHSVLTVRRSRDGYLPTGRQIARLDGGPNGFRLGQPSEGDVKALKAAAMRSRITDFLADHPRSNTSSICLGVTGNNAAILAELKAMEVDEVVAVARVGNANLYYLTGVVVEIDASRDGEEEEE